MKRTPLKSNPEKTRAWQQRRRKPLKHRSHKQSARMERVKPMYEARFLEFPVCEVEGCWKPSTEPHHFTIDRRRGDGLFRFRVVCGSCHFHAHHVSPAEARAKGILDCLTEDDWGKPNGGRIA